MKTQVTLPVGFGIALFVAMAGSSSATSAERLTREQMRTLGRLMTETLPQDQRDVENAQAFGDELNFTDLDDGGESYYASATLQGGCGDLYISLAENGELGVLEPRRPGRPSGHLSSLDFGFLAPGSRHPILEGSPVRAAAEDILELFGNAASWVAHGNLTLARARLASINKVCERLGAERRRMAIQDGTARMVSNRSERPGIDGSASGPAFDAGTRAPARPARN